MGRWTQYDDDDHRLPEGMKRVGYDADTQRYTFRSGNQLWLGEPGARYGGNLTRAGTAPQEDSGFEDHVPLQTRADGYQALSQGHDSSVVHSNRKANQMMLPFILLVFVFLLFVWRFIVSDSPPLTPPRERTCADGPEEPKYYVKTGDTCWDIAQSHETNVQALLNETLNPGLDCDGLKPGDVLCLPPQVT